MRDAVREMGEIEARIGVNTGDVLARDATQGESLVVGDAVNVAARLEQAAAPGEVLVGEATWALVGHAAHGERVASIAAKGKREPLAAWRLDGVDPAARGQRRRLDLPMVGREAELDLLRWALERTEPGSAAAPRHGARAAGDREVAARLGAAAPGRRAHRAHRPVPCDHGVVVARAAARGGARRDPRRSERLRGRSPAHGAATRMPPRSPRACAEARRRARRRLGGVTPDRRDGRDADRRRSCSRTCTGPSEPPARRRRAAARRQPPASAPGRLHRQAGVRRPAARLGDGGEPVVASCWSASTTRRRGACSRTRAPALGDRAGRADHRRGRGQPAVRRASGGARRRRRRRPAGLPRSIQVLLTARLEALPEPEREVVGVAAVAGRDFPVDRRRGHWSAGRSRPSSTASPSAS